MRRTPYESDAAPTSHSAADPAEFNVVCRSKSNLPNRTDSNVALLAYLTHRFGAWMERRLERVLFSKNTTWKFMQIMYNAIWRVVIRLLFSRGSLSWFVSTSFPGPFPWFGGGSGKVSILKTLSGCVYATEQKLLGVRSLVVAIQMNCAASSATSAVLRSSTLFKSYNSSEEGIISFERTKTNPTSFLGSFERDYSLFRGVITLEEGWRSQNGRCGWAGCTIHLDRHYQWTNS